MNLQSIQEELAQEFIDSKPSSAAAVIEKFSTTELDEMFATLSPKAVAKCIPFIPLSRARQIILATPKDQIEGLLGELDPSVTVSLFAGAGTHSLRAKLTNVSPAMRAELEEILDFPAGSAATLMDKRFISVQSSITVKEALKPIRQSKDRELVEVFIVDKSGVLVGTVLIQDIALSESTQTLDQLMRPTRASVNIFSQLEEVTEEFEKHKVITMPVIGVDGRLVGVIRHNTLVDSAHKELTKALVSSTGASPEERAFSSSITALKKRLPWLTINLGTAFLAAAVVGLFEDTIAKVTALAVVMPVVAGQSGNTGAQAMAVTMRGLAIREIRPRHYLRMAAKELSAGLMNGTFIALISTLSVYLWSSDIVLAFVLGTSMVFSMVTASVTGTLIPIILTVAGRDPAQASSIILTTFTDVVSFSSFLGLATLLISYMTA